jgi:hypothetical protein
MMRTKEEAIEMFRYKAPNGETLPKYELVNAVFVSLVEAIYDVIPDGPGKTAALRKLSDARMAFSSAIANGGR